jgi:hypothetical protein
VFRGRAVVGEAIIGAEGGMRTVSSSLSRTMSNNIAGVSDVISRQIPVLY